MRRSQAMEDTSGVTSKGGLAPQSTARLVSSKSPGEDEATGP